MSSFETVEAVYSTCFANKENVPLILLYTNRFPAGRFLL